MISFFFCSSLASDVIDGLCPYKGVCARKHTQLCVEHMLAEPRPAITAVSLTRYDTNGVYALKHTRMHVENTLAGQRPAVRACSQAHRHAC